MGSRGTSTWGWSLLVVASVEAGDGLAVSEVGWLGVDTPTSLRRIAAQSGSPPAKRPDQYTQNPKNPDVVGPGDVATTCLNVESWSGVHSPFRGVRHNILRSREMLQRYGPRM
eukprot:9488529-Pyramimonas_sp.AAC.1